MSNFLEDIALTPPPILNASGIQWVGMRGIDSPVKVMLKESVFAAPAKFDVAVNLPLSDKRGIHMSRLHSLIDEMSENYIAFKISPEPFLVRMIESHKDCETSAAKINLSFPLLLRRPALLTKDLAGWKSYPVLIEAQKCIKEFKYEVTCEVVYSSTCPCSAALSRQFLESEFKKDFPYETHLSVHAASEWIRKNASRATPHSQRSLAKVKFSLSKDFSPFLIEELINQIECSLGTPVQTAVKRQDEQEFARLNGENLMYVEDAVRKIEKSLKEKFLLNKVTIDVTHMESLHPHDAYAFYTEAVE